MTTRLAFIALLAACSAQDGDDYPVLPGDGIVAPTAGSPGLPAQVARGRICIATDPRNLRDCAGGDSSGLAVTLGTSATTTAADGSFSLAVPATVSPTSPMFLISGPGIVPTTMRLTPQPSQTLIPVLRADLFAQMMEANGIPSSVGSGSILGTVVRAGTPVEGVTVNVTPSPAFRPLFDGGSPTEWRQISTGARGVIWVPGVALGPTQLTFRDPATSTETTLAGVPAINGGITIVDAILP